MTTSVQIIMQAVDNASKEIGQVSSGLKTLDKNAENASKTGTKLGSSIGNAVTSLTGMNISALATGGAVAALAGEARKMISAASDLSETQNKVKVVFGESADEIMAFGESAATAMGMSKTAALSAAGTFGNLFVSMGMTSDKSSEMSRGLVKLAADLSSFNNIDSAIVLEKLRAGLTGETEPLKTLGVNLSAAAVSARALAMGLVEEGEALTAAQKAMATYSLILEQTKTAQGDFANTADGAANASRILEAATLDLEAAAGKTLLPTWTNLVIILKDGVTTLGILATWNENVTKTLQLQQGEIANTTASYKEYFAENVKAAIAAKRLHDQTSTDTSWYELQSDIDYVTKKIGVLTETEWNQMQMASQHTAYMKSLAGAYDDVTTAANATVLSQDELKAQFGTLGEIIGGKVGKEIENYETKLGGLNGQHRELSNKIKELKNLPYLSDAQKQELDDLRGKLWENRDAMRELADAHEEAMKRMAFNMLMERAASDGMTENELTNLTNIGQAWGLYDQKTADVIDTINKNMGELDTANPSNLLSLLRSILGLPAEKTFNFVVNIKQNGYMPALGDVGLTPSPLIPVEDTDDDYNFDDRRAAGGPVSGYVMNESAHTRPETLVMGGRNGQVLTKQQAMEAVGGGGGGINIYGAITVIANDPAAFTRQLQALGQKSRQAKISGAQYQGV